MLVDNFFEWLASEIIWNYDGLMLDTAILLFSKWVDPSEN